MYSISFSNNFKVTCHNYGKLSDVILLLMHANIAHKKQTELCIAETFHCFPQTLLYVQLSTFLVCSYI